MLREHATGSVSDTAADINQELNDLTQRQSVECIVICASAVLHSTEVLFQTLQERLNLTRQLVLCGGIGHSTQLIYKAVADHPQFHTLAGAIAGLPEARVLEKILDEFYDGAAIRAAEC